MSTASVAEVNASIDDPIQAEEELAALKVVRPKAKRRKAAPAEAHVEPPKKFEPSKEQIFLLNQELDGGPSPRDLRIHAAVMEEGLSQREVATKHLMSQARVSQIVKKVDEWSLRVAEDRYADYTPQERRRLAENTFRQRLNHFYAQVMQAWRKSQAGETIERDGGLDSHTVTRSSAGKVCYLEMAMRISERIAELDWAGVRRKFREEQEEETAERVSERDTSESQGTEDATSAANSPEAENGLSPVAEAVAELGATSDTQTDNSSGVTKQCNGATRPMNAKTKGREPLITPCSLPDIDPEREELYAKLQTLLDDLDASPEVRDMRQALEADLQEREFPR